MNPKSLSLTLGGAIAASITLAPVVNAAENPFAMQALSASTQVAEAGGKMKDGKCGEGKCGAKKAEAAAGKVKEGQCGANKDSAATDKAKEGSCGANKDGGMKMDETAPATP
jgi:uncharacterized low-complexity protein